MAQTPITLGSGDDNFNAPTGDYRIDGGLGRDQINFGFRLLDANVSFGNNTVDITGSTGFYTLSHFEVYTFLGRPFDGPNPGTSVDNFYYYSQNKDVLEAGANAARHYHIDGWHEGRNPNDFFDTLGYLASNPDVAAAGIDPLRHFHTSGWMEGRVPSPAFDAQAYLAANPDVAAAGIDPLRHYLQHGMEEGRAAIAKPLYDADTSANTVGGHAAAGTGTGVTFSWGGFVSPNLTYALTGDTSGGGFTVDAHTGQVIVADGSKIADNSSYTVTVQASDLGHTISQSATITSGPETNNNKPVFDAPPVDGVQTNEGYPAGRTVFTAHATDADRTAPNNTVHYSLTAHVGDNDAFDINPATGEVSFKTAPDYEAPTDANHDNTYDVTVTATDGGSPARSATETVAIHVENNPADDPGTGATAAQVHVLAASHPAAVTIENDAFHFAGSRSASNTTAGTGASATSTSSPIDDHAAGATPHAHADAPHWMEIAQSHGWGSDAPPDADHHAAPAPVHVESHGWHG